MLETISETPKHSNQLIQLSQSFLEALREQGKSPNTLKNYKTDLDLFIHYFSARDNSPNLKDFNLTKVMEYGSYLEKRYTSDNSKRRRVQTLRLFFDFMVGRGVLIENPVRKLPTSPKFLDIPRPTPLNNVQKLWEYLCKEAHAEKQFDALLAKRNQVILMLIYGSGLKVSDLSKLQQSHITLGEERRVILTPPKRDPYSVPLLPLFDVVYNDYMGHLNDYMAKNQISFKEVLFNANPYRILSGGISARGLEIIFEDQRNKLGLNLTPKSLRQACIFNWLSKDVSDTLIKEWMGVAPSYNLKLYKAHASQHLYTEDFLEKTYFSFIEKKLQ